ncbi:MAG: hypothetical protein JSV42_13710 [Chloroflexota bacterium]|nr:MAG: hypothetical protein JSV42_13710 [Chloroflexota bacterium]
MYLHYYILQQLAKEHQRELISQRNQSRKVIKRADPRPRSRVVTSTWKFLRYAGNVIKNTGLNPQTHQDPTCSIEAVDYQAC